MKTLRYFNDDARSRTDLVGAWPRRASGARYRRQRLCDEQPIETVRETDILPHCDSADRRTTEACLGGGGGGARRRRTHRIGTVPLLGMYRQIARHRIAVAAYAAHKRLHFGHYFPNTQRQQVSRMHFARYTCDRLPLTTTDCGTCCTYRMHTTQATTCDQHQPTSEQMRNNSTDAGTDLLLELLLLLQHALLFGPHRLLLLLQLNRPSQDHTKREQNIEFVVTTLEMEYMMNIEIRCICLLLLLQVGLQLCLLRLAFGAPRPSLLQQPATQTRVHSRTFDNDRVKSSNQSLDSRQ